MYVLNCSVSMRRRNYDAGNAIPVYGFLFLCKPDEMKNLLKISEDEKSELHNYLKQLYHLDNNLEETLENTEV